MSEYWNDGSDNDEGGNYYTINIKPKLKRGPERSGQLHNVIIETMRLNDRPSKKNELQKFCRIRRTRFLEKLAYLIGISVVIRSGTGKKRDPFTYRLVEHYRLNVPPA